MSKASIALLIVCFVGVVALAVIIFWHKAKAANPKRDEPSFEIKEIPSDVPEFKREYSTILPVNSHIKVTITISSTYYKYSKSRERRIGGEMTQQDGRWILFDPEKVADKIIDPVLTPLVEQYSQRILKIDQEFRDSQPSEFTDESGAKWKKVGQP